MAEADPSSYLTDPLSPITRLERRNLLIVSTIGLMVGYVGLVPTRIAALGLEFNAPAQNAFLVLLALVVLYMEAAFAIYALSDFFVWRKRYYDYRISREKEGEGWTQEDQWEYDEMGRAVPHIHWYWQKAPLVAWLRVAFEFILPLAVGIYTVGMLAMLVWHP